MSRTGGRPRRNRPTANRNYTGLSVQRPCEVTHLSHRRQPGLAHEQLIAERVAAMESCAARQEWNTWRGQYQGGAVDFETGRASALLEVADEWVVAA